MRFNSVEVKSRISGIVQIFGAIVVFASLTPLLVTTITGSGATGTEATLLNYLPLFLALGIILWIIGWAIGKLSGTGVSFPLFADAQQIVGVIIIETVGVLFYPLVSTQCIALNTTLVAASMTTAATLVLQIPLFYVLALVFIAIGFGLKAAGKI